MHIHLCIITGQPLANLIPLLQERPDHVALLFTASMEKVKDEFCHTLRQAGFDAEQISMFEGLPDSDFEAISLFCMQVIEELREHQPDLRLTWNATGGTKLMALAVHAALDKTDRIIYTATRHNRLEQLAPTATHEQLQSVLTPELYLTATGRIRRHAASDSDAWQEEVRARQSATRHLGQHADSLGGLIQQFNRALDRNGPRQQSVTFRKIGSQYREALTQLATGELIEWDGESNVITLDGMNNIEYLTGGWLEEYVWLIACDAQFDHIDCSLKFGDRERRKAGEDNELDLFILHRNRALVIECKSGYMGKDDAKDANIIYKLDAVAKKAGGLLVTPVLVSAQELQHNTRAGRKVDTRARARDYNIETVEADKLAELGRWLARWRDAD